METINSRDQVLIQDPMDRQMYHLSPADPRRSLTFKDAVKRCWAGYVDFEGRARRSEYWWFCLYALLILLLPLFFSVLLSQAFEGSSRCADFWGYTVGILMFIVLGGTVVMLIFPFFAAMARRLHDVGVSARWIIWDLVLGVVSFFALSIAFDVAGITNSSADYSIVEMFQAVSDYSVLLFVLVATLLVAQLAMTLIILVFTLLDSRKTVNQYGPSPKYHQETESI